jgi:hypothetical protein
MSHRIGRIVAKGGFVRIIVPEAFGVRLRKDLLTIVGIRSMLSLKMLPDK